MDRVHCTVLPSPPADRGQPRAFIKYRWSQGLNCIIPEAAQTPPPLAVIINKKRS